jgi:hypothetical protein
MLMTTHYDALCGILRADRFHHFRFVEVGQMVGKKKVDQDSVVLINGKSKLRKIIPLSEFYESYVSQLTRL